MECQKGRTEMHGGVKVLILGTSPGFILAGRDGGTVQHVPQSVPD